MPVEFTDYWISYRNVKNRWHVFAWRLPSSFFGLRFQLRPNTSSFAETRRRGRQSAEDRPQISENKEKKVRGCEGGKVRRNLKSLVQTVYVRIVLIKGNLVRNYILSSCGSGLQPRLKSIEFLYLMLISFFSDQTGCFLAGGGAYKQPDMVKYYLI